MAQSRTFRAALFGGYNRDDVDEYIQNMEHEIEAVKLLHQKEKLELIRRAEESEGELSLVKRELEEVRRQPEKTGMPEAGIQPEEPEAGVQTEEAAGPAEGEHLAEEAGPAEEKDVSEEKDALARLQEVLDKLEKENQELKKRMEDRDDLFDYDTVIKIMEEARANAELIEKEAREKAEQMVEKAKAKALEEEERQRRIIASRVNAQLEEKGIQLMAAKYKIEQYIKKISDTQQGLYFLNERMEKMVKDMPVRLDDYWEGEDFRQLEEQKKDDEIPYGLPGTEK